MYNSQTSQPPPWKEDHESVAKRFEDLFEHAFIDLPSVIPDGAHTKDEVRFAFLETFEVSMSACMIISFELSMHAECICFVPEDNYQVLSKKPKITDRATRR